jgi:hypothetical protein
MMVKGVIGTTAQEEVVAMVGGVIAQCTGHGLVQTMVAQQVLYMVHMTEVLFVIAIGGNALGLFSLVYMLVLMSMSYDCRRASGALFTVLIIRTS